MSISALGQSNIPAANPSTSGEITQYGKTSVTSARTAEIEIYTAEGDKVTLSASMQQTASSESYVTYNNLGRSHDPHSGNHDHSSNTEIRNASAAGSSTTVSSTGSYSISIEGNLSRQELQDIHKALQTINQAASKIQSGDLDKAQNKLEKLETLNSLAGLSASIAMQQSATVQTGTIVQTNAA